MSTRDAAAMAEDATDLSHVLRREGNTVELTSPLEDFGDCWPVLRRAWDEMSDGEVLRLRFGSERHGLTSHAVHTLLRLAGFVPDRARRAGGMSFMEGRRAARVARDLSCSVIVPCRNERGNLDALVQRVPALGAHTELIFVDGASSDGTPERIRELIAAYPDKDIRLLEQSGNKGKAGAVFQGFDAATGEVLMILDADMTVAPEDLPRFYLALAEGVADFANGSRLVYPMEASAMRPLNLIGNYLFSGFFTLALQSRITDTLCGTKALFKRDWERIGPIRRLFGGHDVWGDFDLLFGARYVHLRIVDVPVRYAARTAGESKMRPLRHGGALALTCMRGCWSLVRAARWPAPRVAMQTPERRAATSPPARPRRE